MTQVRAILDCLSSKHLEAGLAGGGLRAKAEAHSLSALFNSALRATFRSDRHLDRRDDILEGSRSVLDAHAFPMIRWGMKLLPGKLQDFPHEQTLHDRLAADTAVQMVLDGEVGV